MGAVIVHVGMQMMVGRAAAEEQAGGHPGAVRSGTGDRSRRYPEGYEPALQEIMGEALARPKGLPRAPANRDESGESADRM